MVNFLFYLGLVFMTIGIRGVIKKNANISSNKNSKFENQNQESAPEYLNENMKQIYDVLKDLTESNTGPKNGEILLKLQEMEKSYSRIESKIENLVHIHDKSHIDNEPATAKSIRELSQQLAMFETKSLFYNKTVLNSFIGDLNNAIDKKSSEKLFDIGLKKNSEIDLNELHAKFEEKKKII